MKKILFSTCAIAISSSAYSYETSFAMKHFNFYNQSLFFRELANSSSIPKQQLEGAINLLKEAGTKTVGEEQTEAILRSWFIGRSLPSLGANYSITTWTTRQCVVALRRLEEELRLDTSELVNSLNLKKEKSFRKRFVSLLELAKNEWVEHSKIRSPHDKSLKRPKSLEKESDQGKLNKKNELSPEQENALDQITAPAEVEIEPPLWVDLPDSKPFTFDKNDFKMEFFGKSINTSLNEKMRLHPAVQAGQDVVFVSRWLVVTRDTSGKIISIYRNAKGNDFVTRIMSDEPQEFVGITQALLNGVTKQGIQYPPKEHPVLLMLTPTRLRAYVLSPERPTENVENELKINTHFGSLQYFKQSTVHPSLFVIKAEKFFMKYFYTFDLLTMSLQQHNAEKDLPPF